MTEPADPQEQVSDGRLAAAAAEGVSGAFERLVERHAGWVRNMLTATLRNEQDAEEALQETFVRAFASLGTLREPEALRGWLRAIARSAAADLQRGRKMKPLEEIDEPAAPPGSASPETSETEEKRLAVARAIEALSEPLREAVVLRYDEGMTCEMIAGRLGIETGAVTMRLTRAHRELSKLLAEWGVAP